VIGPRKGRDRSEEGEFMPTNSRSKTGDSIELAVQHRLVKALSHPIRARALMILAERVASPSDIAEELDESLGVVAYHMRTLEGLGCIELVRRAQRRGAVEHYYRALERPWISDEEFDAMPKALRRGLSSSIFKELANDVAVASKGEGLARSDHHMIRFPVLLDATAWGELTDEISALLERILELQTETIARTIESDSDDTTAAIFGLMLFERRVVEHDRRLKAAVAAERKPKGPDVEVGAPREKRKR
jgi:DNA-binding transcriptional ArsR family regulator